MKIEKLNPEGFGIFYNHRIGGFKEGMNIVYGKNEVGKTTLLDFIRMTLFGYPTRKNQRRPPLNGGKHGGKITATFSNGSRYDIYRSGSSKKFYLSDCASGQRIESEREFRSLVSGAEESLFKNIYAITLDELVGLSSLNESGMDDKIYSLGMGLSGVDFGAFEKKLRTEAEEFFLKGGQKQVFIKLAHEIDDLTKKKLEVAGKVADYDRLHREIEEKKANRDRLKKSMVERERELKALENYMSVYSDVLAIQRLRRETRDEKPSSVLPEDYFEDYKKKKDRLEGLKQQHTGIQTELEGKRRELEVLKIDADMESRISDLNFLKTQIEVYRERVSQREKLSREISKLTGDLNGKIERLGEGYELNALLQLSGIHPLKSRARAFIKQIEELDRERAVIEGQLEKAERDIAGLMVRVETQKEEVSAGSLSNEAEREEHMKLSSELEVKLKKIIDRASVENRGQSKGVYFALLGLGVIMSVLGVFLMGEMFFPALFALATGLAVIFMSLWLLMGGKSKVEESESPSALQAEINRISEDMRKYDEDKKELNKLELEIKQQQEQKKDLRNRLENSRGKREKLLSDWRETLLEKGLPGEMALGDSPDLLSEIERIRELYDRKKQAEDQRNDLNAPIGEFEKRLTELDHETGEGQSMEEKGYLLIRQLEDTANLCNKRDELLSDKRRLEKEEKRIRQERLELKEEMSQLYGAAGVENEEGFVEFFDRQRSYLKNRDELVALEEKVEAVAGRGKLENAISFVEDRDKVDVEREIDELSQEVGEKEEGIEQSNLEIGGMETQQKSLLDPGRDAEINSQLEAAYGRMRDAYEKWITLQLARRVVGDCKQKYEEERQPQVLQHSQEIFGRITEGAYQHLKVVLGEADKVRIIDRNSRAKAVGELSRGTREQLLLALRMGLIKEYETHAEPLPVILDDIMVNFDKDRALNTATELVRFAKNRQVILFSCHEHTLDWFKNLDYTLIEMAPASGLSV